MGDRGKYGPNRLLTAARRDRRSPSGSGRDMSRQELAEAVAGLLFDEFKIRVQLDATYIGKLERGEHRWPNDRYRYAFMTVLNAATDGDLGFFVVREHVFPEQAPLAVVLPPELNARGLAAHWLDMLGVLAGWSNGRGAQTVLQLAAMQAKLIDAQRRSLTKTQDQLALLGVQARWYEFTSWVADNAISTPDTGVWISDALRLSQEAGDRRLSSYILMRCAQQAAEKGHAADAVDLAIKARHAFGVMPHRTRALSFVREAHAHALLRDPHASGRAITDAHKALDRAEACDTDALDSHCTQLYVAGYDGYCQLLLGAPDVAINRLEEVLSGWPSDMRQDEVMWRAWLASAYTAAGHYAAAGATANRALDLALITRSARAWIVLQPLSRQLADSPHTAEVQQFLQTFTTSTENWTH